MSILDSAPHLSYGTCDSDERASDRDDVNGILNLVEEEDFSSDNLQEGVAKIEAVSQTWTQRSLIVAYLGIFLMAFCTSLEGQTTSSLAAYATSSFSKHSLISTVLVVQNVVNAVIKPPMAKVADVFGRFEAFCISIVVYVLGYIQMAASTNVQTYASAQIFYSAGSTALQILQQIFIADSSDLLNRAFFALLPQFPFLATVWIGPMIASLILKHITWRFGYGMWAAILPTAFLPLGLSLLLNQRKARRLNLIKMKVREAGNVWDAIQETWLDLDMFGLLLLSGAVALILIPLTIGANASSGWKNGSIITMMLVGCICLLLFFVWESSRRLAPKPLLSMHLLTERTALAGCVLAFFYFMAFYFSVQPYFYSYLQVVQNLDVAIAGHITQTFAFTSTITAFAVSISIKYSRRYQLFVVIGSAIYICGLLAMSLHHREGSSVVQIIGAQVLLGAGGGLLNVPVQLGVQASAKHKEVAAATAMFLTSLEMGGAVGAAISGAIWTYYVPRKLHMYLPPESRADAEEIFGKLTKAVSYPMESPTRIAINQAYQETMDKLICLAVIVSLPLIPLSLLMRNYRLDKISEGMKDKVIGTIRQETSIEERAHSE